ncbi:MAG TPA: serine/threonine-protein kinase [Polyangiaceae bacterium]|nr:serine/threonine-protein kinase [Polyangiaceae bacterium]
MAHCRMAEPEAELEHAVARAGPASGARKYHLLMQLGRGGTAVVHAALARGIGGFSKLVVLKVTRPELADHPEAVRMFLNEARVSARMNHPNVVQVYEVVEDQGLPVMVMEYLEGQSFATLLRRLHESGGYSVNLGLSVVCKALEGLHYAHSLTDFSGRPLKIIHRDVTPHNIFVTYEGQVKLLDFGIAKVDATADHTKTGVIKGKLAYMPREQIDGSDMDCRTDLFAVGVILWEVVAGQRMWGTLSDATLMKALLCNDIPRLRDAKPDVDPELEQIINKAIEPEPDDRYGSAQELLAALTAYLESHGGMSAQSVIAELLTRTCADLKEQTRKRLERELAKFSQSADGNWNEVPPEFTGSGPKQESEFAPHPEPRQRRPSLHDSATRTGFAGQASSSAPLPVRRRGARVVALVGAAAALVALVGYAAFTPAPERPLVHGAAPSGAPALAAAAPATTIRVRFAATPDQAELYLDGVRLQSNPYSSALPMDEREHELRATAEGFAPVTRKLRFDADFDLQLALAPVQAVERSQPGAAGENGNADSADEQKGSERSEAKPARKPVSSPRRAAASTRPAPTRSTAAPAHRAPEEDPCNPPYVVNELGVKRYKRECLK